MWVWVCLLYYTVLKLRRYCCTIVRGVVGRTNAALIIPRDDGRGLKITPTHPSTTHITIGVGVLLLYGTVRTEQRSSTAGVRRVPLGVRDEKKKSG